MLKKLISFTGIFALFSMWLSPLPVSAQTFGQTLKAEELLPKDIDLVVEFNSSVKNPLENLDLSSLSENFSEDEEKNQKMVDLLSKVLDNNLLTFATDIHTETTDEEVYPQNDIYLTFSVSDADVQEFLSMQGTELKKTTYKDFAVFSHGDLYVTKISNLLVITNKEQTMQATLDRYLTRSSDTLKNNTVYQNTRNQKVANEFLNVYVSPATFANADFHTMTSTSMQTLLGPSNIVEAFLGESISVSQTDKGLDFNMFVEGDKSKLENLNMLFSKHNFIPELYKQISGTDLLMYTESFNTSENFETSWKAAFETSASELEPFTDMQADIETETGINMQNDVLPLLNGRMLMTVHKTDQVFPAVTLMTEAKNNTAKVPEFMNKVKTYLDKKMGEIEQEKEIEFYSTSSVDIKGTIFNKFDFNLEKIAPEMKTNVTLLMGQTSDGHLIITTHPNFQQIYKQDQGLLVNTTFKTKFTNPQEQTTGVVFMDFDKLQDYIKTSIFPYLLEVEYTDYNEEEKQEWLEYAQKNLNDMLGPWNNLYVKSYATDTTALSKGTLEIDEAAFAFLRQSFIDLLSLGIESEVTWEEPYLDDCDEDVENCNADEEEAVIDSDVSTTFCDVKDGDWFSADVSYAQELGFVKGSNGCFRPYDNISRAEFVTISKRVTDNLSWLSAVSEEEMNKRMAAFNFKDAVSSDWYFNDLKYAYGAGWIKGYNDNTVRPHASISRAEAMQIFYNLSDQIQKEAKMQMDQNASLPFSDVEKSHWAYSAILGNYGLNIAKGKNETTFDPNGSLTRAEAAAIFMRFYYLHGLDVEPIGTNS